MCTLKEIKDKMHEEIYNLRQSIQTDDCGRTLSSDYGMEVLGFRWSLVEPTKNIEKLSFQMLEDARKYISDVIKINNQLTDIGCHVHSVCACEFIIFKSYGNEPIAIDTIGLSTLEASDALLFQELTKRNKRPMELEASIQTGDCRTTLSVHYGKHVLGASFSICHIDGPEVLSSLGIDTLIDIKKYITKLLQINAELDELDWEQEYNNFIDFGKRSCMNLYIVNEYKKAITILDQEIDRRTVSNNNKKIKELEESIQTDGLRRTLSGDYSSNVLGVDISIVHIHRFPTDLKTIDVDGLRGIKKYIERLIQINSELVKFGWARYNLATIDFGGQICLSVSAVENYKKAITILDQEIDRKLINLDTLEKIDRNKKIKELEESIQTDDDRRTLSCDYGEVILGFTMMLSSVDEFFIVLSTDQIKDIKKYIEQLLKVNTEVSKLGFSKRKFFVQSHIDFNRKLIMDDDSTQRYINAKAKVEDELDRRSMMDLNYNINQIAEKLGVPSDMDTILDAIDGILEGNKQEKENEWMIVDSLGNLTNDVVSEPKCVWSGNNVRIYPRSALEKAIRDYYSRTARGMDHFLGYFPRMRSGLTFLNNIMFNGPKKYELKLNTKSLKDSIHRVEGVGLIPHMELDSETCIRRLAGALDSGVGGNESNDIQVEFSMVDDSGFDRMLDWWSELVNDTYITSRASTSKPNKCVIKMVEDDGIKMIRAYLNRWTDQINKQKESDEQSPTLYPYGYIETRDYTIDPIKPIDCIKIVPGWDMLQYIPTPTTGLGCGLIRQSIGRAKRKNKVTHCIWNLPKKEEK